MKNLIRESFLGNKGKDDESLLESYMSIYEEKGEKPDFLDMDKDGDKEESMKKALKDKEEKEEVEEQFERPSQETGLLEKIIQKAEASLQGQGGGMPDLYASYSREDLFSLSEKLAETIAEYVGFADKEGADENFDIIIEAISEAML
jgi:hypothetical protein